MRPPPLIPLVQFSTSTTSYDSTADSASPMSSMSASSPPPHLLTPIVKTLPSSEIVPSPPTLPTFPTTVMNSNVAAAGPSYPCSYCGKTFGQPYNLRRHLTTHTGERKFKCPYCVYRATQNVHLDKHIRRIHPNVNNAVMLQNNNQLIHPNANSSQNNNQLNFSNVKSTSKSSVKSELASQESSNSTSNASNASNQCIKNSEYFDNTCVVPLCHQPET